MRPVDKPEFWNLRIDAAVRKGRLWECVWSGVRQETWDAMNDLHRNRLNAEVIANDRVLDIGCGYGRLLDLMPARWNGGYLGVDPTPRFINLARIHHPNRCFVVGDLRWYRSHEHFDLGVAIMVHDMVVGSLGQKEWNIMELNLRSLCSRILILEPSPDNCRLIECD